MSLSSSPGAEAFFLWCTDITLVPKQSRRIVVAELVCAEPGDGVLVLSGEDARKFHRAPHSGYSIPSPLLLFICSQSASDQFFQILRACFSVGCCHVKLYLIMRSSLSQTSLKRSARQKQDGFEKITLQSRLRRCLVASKPASPSALGGRLQHAFHLGLGRARCRLHTGRSTGRALPRRASGRCCGEA